MEELSLYDIVLEAFIANPNRCWHIEVQSAEEIERIRNENLSHVSFTTNYILAYITKTAESLKKKGIKYHKNRQEKYTDTDKKKIIYNKALSDIVNTIKENLI